jgi:dienelactone hydrolase
MREQLIEYRDGETVCEGFLCHDDSQPGPRPAVLINHMWGGRDEFVERKARRLAWSGYACLALDNYGKGRRGGNPELNAALMAPFTSDRAMLRRRLLAGLAAAKSLPFVDAHRIAVIGYCFGGLCALDFARANADVRGVVSIHGMLTPSGLTEPKIDARVLMLHGFDDPLAPPEDMLAARGNSRPPEPTGRSMPTDTRCTLSPTPRPTTVRAECSTTRSPIDARGMRSRSSSARSSSSDEEPVCVIGWPHAKQGAG